MNLAVFDVDGTLLDNHACENECYAAALREVLGLPMLDSRWHEYEHVTDTGIAVEAFRRYFGVEPGADQISATIVRFVALLQAACEANASAIVPIAGAEQILPILLERGWAVAIATGAWRRAAEFKLGVAGIERSDVPLASAEDGPARVTIVERARVLAERRYGVERFERVVSVGDGVWDVTAARSLRVPFVGIGSDRRAERLSARGTGIVLADFSDRDLVLEALENAGVPA
jgi:phosphoglycolate phosphatase-like HAD superfamily hydrolase